MLSSDAVVRLLVTAAEIRSEVGWPLKPIELKIYAEKWIGKENGNVRGTLPISP